MTAISTANMPFCQRFHLCYSLTFYKMTEHEQVTNDKTSDNTTRQILALLANTANTEQYALHLCVSCTFLNLGV